MGAIQNNKSLINIFKEYPVTINLFFDKRLDCVGCTMNQFCTMEDVFENYALDREQFLEEISILVQ